MCLEGKCYTVSQLVHDLVFTTPFSRNIGHADEVAARVSVVVSLSFVRDNECDIDER